jgi:hypothetical protein
VFELFLAVLSMSFSPPKFFSWTPTPTTNSEPVAFLSPILSWTGCLQRFPLGTTTPAERKIEPLVAFEETKMEPRDGSKRITRPFESPSQPQNAIAIVIDGSDDDEETPFQRPAKVFKQNGHPSAVSTLGEASLADTKPLFDPPSQGGRSTRTTTLLPSEISDLASLLDDAQDDLSGPLASLMDEAPRLWNPLPPTHSVVSRPPPAVPQSQEPLPASNDPVRTTTLSETVTMVVVNTAAAAAARLSDDDDSCGLPEFEVREHVESELKSSLDTEPVVAAPAWARQLETGTSHRPWQRGETTLDDTDAVSAGDHDHDQLREATDPTDTVFYLHLIESLEGILTATSSSSSSIDGEAPLSISLDPQVASAITIFVAAAREHAELLGRFEQQYEKCRVSLLTLPAILRQMERPADAQDFHKLMADFRNCHQIATVLAGQAALGAPPDAADVQIVLAYEQLFDEYTASNHELATEAQNLQTILVTFHARLEAARRQLQEQAAALSGIQRLLSTQFREQLQVDNPLAAQLLQHLQPAATTAVRGAEKLIDDRCAVQSEALDLLTNSLQQCQSVVDACDSCKNQLVHDLKKQTALRSNVEKTREQIAVHARALLQQLAGPLRTACASRIEKKRADIKESDRNLSLAKKCMKSEENIQGLLANLQHRQESLERRTQDLQFVDGVVPNRRTSGVIDTLLGFTKQLWG